MTDKPIRAGDALRLEHDLTEPQETASSTHEKPSWVKRLVSVFLAIVCAGVGSFMTIVWGNWESRTRVLEYHASAVSAIITKPELGGKTVEIVVEGRPVDNISTVSVQLYNRTDHDYTELPVLISFEAVGGSPVRPLKAVLRNRLDAPATTVGEPQIDSQGRTTFEYDLELANRSERPVMEVDYAFEGEVAPRVEVFANAPGVDVVAIDVADTRTRASWWRIVLPILVGCTLAGALYTWWRILQIFSFSRLMISKLIELERRNPYFSGNR